MAEPNWKNRTLFHGDNLKFLRAMNSESVDLIATDPPFNKGRDFHATPDSLAAGAKFQDRWSWERDVHEEWTDQIKDDYPRLMEAIESARYAHSDGMGAYMCFMAVRLLAMRRVLKPTGSIYLHCDPTASHYLKATMDAIFGWKKFLGEIIWDKQNGSKSKRKWGNEHEVLLVYAKELGKQTLNVKDPALRKPYADISQQMHFTKKDELGRSYREKRVGEKVYIYYADDGRFIGNLWMDISSMSANSPLFKTRYTGHATPKPIPLYERIIKASTKEGDIVLDPFAGCATTCVAADRLGRDWVGIDIWEKAYEMVQTRLENEVGPFGDITFTDQLPDRTDDGDTAAPFLRVKQRVREPEGPRWTRAQMYEHLLEQDGPKCQGCERTFDDPRYLELDHKTPRSDGGLNHISNRILLCGPCNKLKSNQYTLSGLQRQNKKLGYMAGSGGEHPIMKDIRVRREKAPKLFD